MNALKSAATRFRSRRMLATTGVAALAVATAVTVGAFAPASAGQASPSLPDNPASDPALMSYIQTHDTPMGQEIRTHMPVQDVAITPDATHLKGLDVSAYQGNVNWSSVKKHGAKFAYVKATEGTSYRSAYFSQQYNGSAKAGLIRGAYHFAHPNSSSGTAQANYFIAHGGKWSKDGKTLPGALDIEFAPSGNTCYGLGHASMAKWIREFVKQYHAKEHVYPVIYTNANWWRECVGTSAKLASTDPLWTAAYTSSPGSLPYNWKHYTFWQYNDHGTFPGDQNIFNGDMTHLKALAMG